LKSLDIQRLFFIFLGGLGELGGKKGFVAGL
jgi:hypothetical protein